MSTTPTTVREVLERVAQGVNDGDSDLTAVYQFDFEGDDVYRLVIVDGHCELVEGREDEPTTTLLASADDALKIFTGQVDSMKAFMEGRMRIEGDLMAMATLQAFMPGGSASVGGPAASAVVEYIDPADSPALVTWQARCDSSKSLREVADARGFFLGAALGSPTEASAPEIAPRTYNCIGAENAFKWRALANKVGEYDFAVADSYVDYAQAHGQRLRGHTLIWGRAGRPDNLEAVIRKSSDPTATLRQLMQEHITTVLDRYRGQVAVWDVVNEPMAYGGEGLDQNVFVEHLGEGYIAESFEIARSVDSDVELVLNEQISSGQYDDVGGREFLALVERLVAQGVPMDGVGLQGHMLNGVPDRTALRGYLRRIEDLGLFIEFTEVDLRIGLFASHDDPLGAQAEAYHMLVELAVESDAVRGLMFWGAADTHSWLDHFPPFDAAAPNQPLLFDRNLNPKPAYYAVQAALADY